MPGSHSPLMPPDGTSLAPGAPSGTGAAYEADGSITLVLGTGTALVTFTVSRGRCSSGPGVSGQPRAGQIGGTVRFPGPTSSRPGCA